MSFNDNFWAEMNKDKKKKKEQNLTVNNSGELDSFSSNFYKALNDDFNGSAVLRPSDYGKKSEDIAPVKEERTWFQAGAFEDGYDFGDISKVILGTATDISENLTAGALGIVEGVVDAGATLVAGGSKLFGADDFANDVEGFIKKDIIDEEAIARYTNATMPIGMLNMAVNGFGPSKTDENSLLGEKTDSLIQSGGQLGATIALQSVGVPWWLTSGVTSFGGEVDNALNQGASLGEASVSGLVSAGADILTEKLFGGSGLGEKGLINLEPLTKGISNKVVKTLAGFGLDMAAEGTEEVVAGVTQNLGTALYREENVKDILLSEEAIDGYIESFIGGAALGGIMNAGKAKNSVRTGQDYRTGLTTSDEKVIGKVYNDVLAEQQKNGKELTKKDKDNLYNSILENVNKGYIDIDTIESELGGEDYKTYKDISTLVDEMTKQKDKLGNKANPTLAEQLQFSDMLKRLEDTKAKKAEARTKLDETLSPLLKYSRINESYNEKARKGQKFTADLSKYKGKQREAVQRAIDSGVLNDTNRSHELVDILSKIESDKGILFDYTNNEKLKASGFAIEGRTVNGFEQNGKVTLNVQSPKAWESTVGHEISHVLEGTESYNVLQSALFEYAKSKNDYQGRYDNLAELYKNVKGYETDFESKIQKELTADLVGDYLFNDKDFVKRLTGDRTLFERVYEEIKYLCKMATGKELTEIEKVKREFDKVWKELSVENVKGTDENAKLSMSGINSKTADSSLLLKAEDMLKNGVDSETVRQETGWYKGYDGKMRYEIDDSEFAFHPDGQFTNPDVLRYRELQKKFVNGEIAENEFEEMQSLTKNLKGVKITPDTLGDVVSHKALFEAYPMLKNVGFKYNTLNKNTNAQYSPSNKTIVINNKLIGDNEAIKNALIHEIQHAVQDIEGFAQGASIEYWKTQRQDIVDTIRGARENLDLWLDDIGYSEFEKASMQEVANREKTIEQHWEDCKEFKANSKYAEQIAACEAELAEFQQQYDEITNGMTAYEQYQNTAGEIEARDAENRLNLTAEERKNTRPDIDRENVVFADAKYSISTNEKKLENSEKILYDNNNPLAIVNRAKTDNNSSIKWVYKSEIFSVAESKLFHDKISEINQGSEAFEKNSIGEYMLPIENKIVFTNGDYNSPYVREVIEVLTDSQTTFDDIRRCIYDVETGHTTKQEATRVIQQMYGDILVVSYNGRNDGVYAWQDRKRKGKTRRTVVRNYLNKLYGRRNDSQINEAQADLNNGSASFMPEDIAPTKPSLSKEGEQPSTVGTPLQDLYYEEDIAPVQEGIAEDIAIEDAPIADEDLFPEGYAPATAEEMEAIGKESFEALTDDDAPIEVENDYYSEPDTTSIDNKTLKTISNGLRDKLSLNAKETKLLAEIVQNYSTSENPNKAELYEAIKEKFGTKEWRETNEEVAEIKRFLKTYAISVPNEVRSDIPDWSHFRKANQNKVKFSKDGLPVDVAYGELSEMFPGWFDTDITHPADQLAEIIDIANQQTYSFGREDLSEETLQETVDMIVKAVSNYKIKTARETAQNALMEGFDAIAPTKATQIATGATREARLIQNINNYPIKTVKERTALKIQNLESELADIKQLRRETDVSFEKTFDRLMREYESKRDKNTQVAHNLIRRMAKLQTRYDNISADYEKRANDIETRIENMKSRSYDAAEETRLMRKELHKRIIDGIKSAFSGEGFDFDTVLKDAKNLSTFSTVDNIPQRVMEKALGYKEGQILSDITVNKVAQNETEGIKWLDSITNRKNGLLAQLSKKYNIKPGSKESKAAQIYAEGFYVTEDNQYITYGDAELAQDFPNVNVQRNIKGLAQDPRIRQFYDKTLDSINEARTRNAFPEIKKLDNYYLHFRAMEDTFSKLGIPFNPNDIKAKDLPTDLNGVTADLKPGKPFFASEMHRRGDKTTYDLLGGLERYATAAKNQIYHIDDIQTLRALRNYIADTYGQAKGLESLDSLTEEEAQERIKEVYNSHLSTFAKFLNEEANVIAGKTALIDRGIEGIIGRRGITFLDTINKQVGSNMVGFNISSSLTNFIPVAQTFAKSNKFDFVKAFAQTVSNKLGSIVGKSDSFTENSPVVIRRKGTDRFYRTPFQKVADKGYFLMSAVDDISTELIARTKFNELTRKGMSEQEAHLETDKWVSRLMGDRSLGQMPQLYNSKMLGILTKFQLEVRNQLDSQFYDTIQEAKASNEDIENGLARNAKTAAKVTSTFVQLAVAQHLFGKAFESVAGYNPAFDIISVLVTALGLDDDEESEDKALDNVEQGFLALMEDMPYSNLITGGGRIPISSALPIQELFTGKDEYGNEKSRLEILGEVAPYYVLPGGYGQLKKTSQGLGMFNLDEEHPVAGSYNNSGKLRFPVEDTLANRVQAGIFGQYANENAREYFDNDYAPLKEKQIQEYKDVDIPIKDYWEYREGLAKQETLEDKFDYIASLDLPVEKKNILINNIVDRKEDVDLENYEDFSGLEEFYYATNNPDKYALAKSVGGYSTYKSYSKDLYNIKADKDKYGKTISGSRKAKVLDYINSLDADYETKIILFKSEYPSDDSYNAEIVDYINNRDDLTYEERVAIFTELGFRISNGQIYAD